MIDPITPFGKRWEIRHSIWMIWLFGIAGLTSFISFLYIGSRMKKVKWNIAALIYFICMAQYFFYGGDYDIDHIIFEISLVIALAAWVISIIHGFNARREYLRLLATKIIKDPYITTPPYLVKTRYFNTKGPMEVNTIKKIKKKKKNVSIPVADKEKPFMLPINKASLKDIASHPYISNVVARQIVDARKRVKTFESFAHLVQETNMKPHVIAKAKPYLIFDEKAQTKEHPPEKQEEVKKKEYSTGRIVDY
ncbi:ComEA family DNA-binding protein [Salirhabdus sp. Marseille-P4669]|uniref:ComEA family DNA-binding protein n=1 Tax=Salirhabdus sp. Marseille-P4669 TaxID=2042310 RepID=UPI000C7DD69A|nr:helix-hairpin-helix domain-containing protein [Salirhabdus sp. Marseille-P4669]